jgi:glycosyltransferase involved in cell wall biosynthesis
LHRLAWDERSREFLGWRSDEEVRELYQRASAVLLPGIEDFGMVPVEAQACGTPVVALGAGGACETVQHGVTGVLVDHESVEAFANGIDECQRQRFDREAIRAGAERFSRERFLRDFPGVVSEAMGVDGSHDHTSIRQTAGRRS